MKRCLYIIPAIILLLSSCVDNIKESKAKGSVWGIISLSTGARAYGAEISLEPGGESTSTGSDGRYSIEDLSPGTYTITVKLKGCQQNNETIVIESNKKTEYSTTLDVIPAKITFEPEILDFGEQDESRTFSIVHNSDLGPLQWHVSYDCKWIKETNPAKDLDVVSEPGKTKTIKVTIDRDQIPFGNNETHILIISEDNGRAEIKVKASNTKRLPSSNMDSVSDVTQYSATFVGTMTDIGSPAVNERGFVYSLSENPTVNSTNVSASLTDDKTFSTSVNNLKEGTTYYVRAYTKSADGVSYSNNEISFFTIGSYPEVKTTAIKDIDVVAKRATFVGEVQNEGNPVYSERGFCYNTTGNPTINDKKEIVTGSGQGEFSYECSGLNNNASYFARAYVIQEGRVYYGAVLSFCMEQVATTVITSAATQITASSARLNGSIMNAGNPRFTEKGFCYSESSSTPTINDKKVQCEGSGDGDFSIVLSNLNYDQIYYFRAYAIQNGTAIYGNVVYFWTSFTKAEVLTLDPTINSYDEIKLSGTVSVNGDPRISERGFCYRKSSNGAYIAPTISDTKVKVSGTSAGDYSGKMTDFEEETIYWIRSYVIQEGTTIYGNAKSIDTPYRPLLSTGPVINIQSVGNGIYYQATFQGAYIDGDPYATDVGFAYSFYDAMPEVGKNTSSSISYQTLSKNSDDIYVYKSTVTTLSYNSTYYVRTYAKTTFGYTYGEVQTFSTNE